MTISQADIESQLVGDADLYPNLVPMTLKAFSSMNTRHFELLYITVLRHYCLSSTE